MTKASSALVFTSERFSIKLGSQSAFARDPSAMSQPRPAVQPDAHLAHLVSAMAAGNQQAMGELYDRTSSLIHAVALRMLANPQDAEEVVLDVFMKAWRNAPSYTPERGSVTAWLVMMSRTVAIDRIRSRHAQPRTLDLSGSDFFPEIAVSPDNPEAATAHNQWRQRIHAAMADLPPEQREALLLAFFGGLSHAELSERLDLPLGTIKTRIRLGLKRLRGVLGESV